MGIHIKIRIRENSFEGNIFSVTLSFHWPDESVQEFQLQLPNPYDPKTDALLEWYFEEYISMPYDDVKVNSAVKSIKEYGKLLFQQLFTTDSEIYVRYRTAVQNTGPENFIFEIIGNSPAFQGMYWESLLEAGQSHPLAALGAVFIRKNVNPLNVQASVEPSPVLNLLIVTARPGEESDVDYRTIQRPLVELIGETETPVNAHILRPGTYEALIRHLDHKSGYYHIIHFDLHGSLLDYVTYQQYRESLEDVPMSNALYGGSFGLQELEEEDFNDGNKAFIFFESEEKGTAVAVEAGQLADLLEHKQIPVCILNACQSAKQDNSAHETSLGLALVKKGIQLVLAMRYSVSVTAARVMMEMLYRQIYLQKPIVQAIALSRKELYRNKKRKAVYDYTIELEDWLLPVVYQNGKPLLNLRNFTPEEEEEFITKQQLPKEARQELTYEFFGRDLDILKIEKNLLLRSNILLLQGMGGAGKTTLLKYLSGWWLRTGLVQRVFYFGYEVKAYTLNEILYHLAQKIYSSTDYASFTALSTAVQENRIVKALKTKSFVLILDNVESITGEKLSIPHTLAEEERQALKNFIQQLKGGKSPVIIGSRSSEAWLKSGTFDNNCYLLRGLDPESAANFANLILHEIQVSVKAVTNDEDFKRLMKLLAGYPLALKAILPNLKHKTANRILKELGEGVGELDEGNVQEKTQSIIKCIEYAHSNLSEEAQQLLLCLAPFQSVINLDPEFLEKYFIELRKEEYFQYFPFDKFQTVVKEAVQNGFMEKAIPDSSYPMMNLQPVFTYFLKNKLISENTSLIQSLESAYIRYYRGVSDVLGKWVLSPDPQLQKKGIELIEYEYENLYKVLILSLNRQENILKIHGVVIEFLKKKQLYQESLSLSKMAHEKILRYDTNNQYGEIELCFFSLKLTLANSYFDLKQIIISREHYEDALSFLQNSPYFNVNSDIQYAYSGHIYYSLGLIAKNQRDSTKARNSFLKALENYVLNQNLQGQGRVNKNLGNISVEEKKYTSAIEYFQKALNNYRQYQDFHSQGKVYQDLGLVSREQGNFDEAIDYNLKALNIYVEYQDVHGQAQIYQNLGVLYGETNDFNTAMEYFHKALKIYVHNNNFNHQGQIYHNLGNIADEIMEYPLAIEYYQKALNIYIQTMDSHLQGQIYQNLASVSQKQEDYLKAKNYYQKALQIFSESPQDPNCAFRMNQISQKIQELPI